MIFNVWMLQFTWDFGQVGTDFAVFWRAANSSTPYVPSREPFGSPPTALMFFQVFRLASPSVCLATFTAMGIAAFVWSSGRLYGRSAAVLGLLSPAAVHGLIAGQVSLIVASLVFAAFLSQASACGTLLAVAICVKPQMCFLAPLLFIITGRWSALVWFACTVVLLCALATAIFDPSIWIDWRGGVATLLKVAVDRGALWLSVAPAGFGLPWIFALPFAAASLYALRDEPPSTQAASLVAASILAAPYALTYDLVAAAPFAALVLLRQRGVNSWGAYLGFTAVFGPIGPVGALIAARQSPVDRAL